MLLTKFLGFASSLRASRQLFSHSQAPCELPDSCFLFRKLLASFPTVVSSFASPLRASRQLFSLSQAPCELPNSCFLFRKPLASFPTTICILAGLPRGRHPSGGGRSFSCCRWLFICWGFCWLNINSFFCDRDCKGKCFHRFLRNLLRIYNKLNFH